MRRSRPLLQEEQRKTVEAKGNPVDGVPTMAPAKPAPFCSALFSIYDRPFKDLSCGCVNARPDLAPAFSLGKLAC